MSEGPVANRDLASVARPRHGGRVDLDDREVTGTSVRYCVTLATPDGAWRGVVHVALADGAVRFDGWLSLEGLPAWLVAVVQSVLRMMWKDRRGAASEPWPERITRWREAKAAG